jgi:hypothetical protein
MKPKELDIFSGSINEQPVWLESVAGLAAASQRMMERAAHEPGRYFIYDAENRNVLECVDTAGGELGRAAGQTPGYIQQAQDAGIKPPLDGR